jgi:hypothetical protein
MWIHMNTSAAATPIAHHFLVPTTQETLQLLVRMCACVL